MGTTMNRILGLALILPLTACLDESEESAIEVTGELPSTSSGFSSTANLANAGALVGNDTRDVFGESLSSTGNGATSLTSSEAGIQSRALIIDAAACDSSGSISVDVTEQAFTFIFDDCINDEAAIDGQLGFSIAGDLETFVQNIENEVFDFTLNADYQDIQIRNGNDYVNIDGNITTGYQLSSTQWTYEVSSTEIEYSDSNENAFTLNNYNLSMEGNISLVEGSDGTYWNYDYYITNSEGTFHVTSDGDIELQDGISELRTGTIFIEGVNAILTIQLDADAIDTNDQVSFSLDLDKDGSEDVTGTMSQATFYNGL